MPAPLHRAPRRSGTDSLAIPESDSRGRRVTVGGLGTSLFYTERVPPAAAPHGGHRAAFVVLVLVAVLFVVALI
jgi:hypothetical protein